MASDLISKLIATVKKWLLFFINPRMILCFLIAWMITNGWSYVFVALGSALGITWMTVIGSTWLGLLWLPFTPEKIVTLFITLFLLRLLFPNDKKTLSVLREEIDKAKAEVKKLASFFRRKKTALKETREEKKEQLGEKVKKTLDGKIKNGKKRTDAEEAE